MLPVWGPWLWVPPSVRAQSPRLSERFTRVHHPAVEQCVLLASSTGPLQGVDRGRSRWGRPLARWPPRALPLWGVSSRSPGRGGVGVDAPVRAWLSDPSRGAGEAGGVGAFVRSRRARRVFPSCSAGQRGSLRALLLVHASTYPGSEVSEALRRRDVESPESWRVDWDQVEGEPPVPRQ